MFSQYEFETIKKEFDEKQKIRRKKLINVWGILLFIVSMIFIAILLIFEIYTKDSDSAGIFYFFSGIIIFGFALGLIISIKYISVKPYFGYLFPRIIEKINDEEGLFLTYDAYPKLDKAFNEEGGLFPKGASIASKRVIQGYSKEQDVFHIIDCMMTTQAGNNQVTHFDGSYIYLQKPSQTELQIRSNGSPNLKGEKYEKKIVDVALKVYKPVGVELTDIDQRYIRLIDNLKKDDRFRYLYFGINKQSCHLAIWYRKNPVRKKKNLNLEILNQYYKDFGVELEFINILENLSLDQY